MPQRTETPEKPRTGVALLWSATSVLFRNSRNFRARMADGLPDFQRSDPHVA